MDPNDPQRLRDFARDNDVPHITAACAACNFEFDLKYRLDCPNCSHVGVAWASLHKGPEPERTRAAIERIREWRSENYYHRDWGKHYASTPTKYEQESIAECEAIFALQDDRP